eukprot:CAMPEP_0169349318 /NCGR_PEP_ID=MMETSP1017-20121227/23649_1 /TAXON_ID=342587 /ORGANISM="Karlodinium micrum, Strain CCMP2283" /LENGTH=329 /DNA_ID=CAMNT_0009445439 /DNA_START=120 /DNA_END=1109 /DNA_ORIENTATION=-
MPPPKVLSDLPASTNLPTTMVLANGSLQASPLERRYLEIPQVDCGASDVVRRLTSPIVSEDSASIVSSRLQDDAVERAIAQLEMTVQACRGQQNRLVPSPSSQVFSSPALHLASELIRGDREKLPSPVDQRSVPDLRDRHADAVPPTPSSSASLGQVALASVTATSEITDTDEEGALQAEALSLRTELRRADARLQAAAAEGHAIKLSVREDDERHKLRIQEMEDAIAKLTKDNSRLERSTQQAALEEHRLADVVRSEPVRTDQVLQRLLAECHRLEKENRRVESETAAIREELSSVRGVVARDSRRHGPQPRQTESRRTSLRRLQPWT